MAGIQVGGIVSGLDTNSIVDKLMTQAKIPVDALYGEYEYTKFENEVYTDFNDKLGNLASDLLNMRLESTFKTKLTSSTNESVLTATATTSSAVGSHSVQVTQLAKNSIASSQYTRFALSTAGSNVTKVTGLATDYLSGVHKVTVAQSGSDYIATTEMTVDNIGLMSKSVGDAVDGSIVSASGTLSLDISGSFTVTYNDTNGNAQSLTVTDSSGSFGLAGEEINDVAARLEFAVNQGINNSMGTNATQYLSIRAEYNAGTWNMAMYETTVDDFNIAVGGTDAGSIRDELGFAEAYTPTTSSTAKIYKYHVADSLVNLEPKVFNPVSGVVAGATFTQSDTLSVGSFTIAQDSSLKVSSETYTTYTSAVASTGSGLTTTVKGLDAAGFSETVNTDANGFFTINDVKITIDDYTKLSVNDMLGIINSSGAGVNASYDSTLDKFIIKSNTTGSTSISLGGYGDTSNMLSLMKLDYNSKPTLSTGSSAGSISSSANLTDSGLTVYPYTGTFTINGVSIYVDTSTESLEDVIEKVNKSGAGVTMAYDSISDKVTLKSDSIDAIEVGSVNDSSNLLEALNLTSNTNVVKTIGTTGQRAILTVDGTNYVRESNSVSDIINGVSLSLNGTGTSSINISVDTSKAVTILAKFMAHYNEVMEVLNVPDKVDEEDSYTAHLSDAEKEAKSESDLTTYLEKYEKYNKYDIIRRSAELRNLDTVMRKTFFAERSGVPGSINDMSDLGIKVAGAGDLDTEFYGYLVEFSTDYETIASKLEENTKFMNALSSSPDDVFNFFANSPDKVASSDPGYNDYLNELGWARYFNTVLVDRYTGSEGMIGNKLGVSGSINTDLTSLEDRISSQEKRVESQLERYWAQFTAMEKAISDAQAQSADFSNASSSG